MRSSLRRVFRRRLLKKLDQWLARVRRLHFAFTHDVLGTEFFPVETLIAAVVGTHRGAFQRHSTKDSARFGPGQNFGLHDNVRLSRGCATNRAGGRGGVRSQLDLAGHHRVGAFLVHNQEDKVYGLPTNLEADTATFERKHRRGTPRTAEVLPRSTSDGTTPVLTTHDKP